MADFSCREARLIVEMDGSQHAESAADAIRDAWLEGQGYRVLRLWNADVVLRTNSVLATILAALPPSPRLRREGFGPLVGSEASPQGDGEGLAAEEIPPASPPHPRLSPRRADDEVVAALSPRAGRGDMTR